MGLANLRNLAIKWNYAAMQRLSKKDENTDESLISKGWTDKETYGKIFDESFQREAIGRIRIREADQDHEREIAELEAVAQEFPIDPHMLDIQNPIRSRVIKQRTSKYESRRGKKRPNKIETLTARITAADIEAQTLRSSSVSLILPEEVQDEDCEEDDEDDDVDESEDEEAPVPVPQRVEQKDFGDVRNSRGRVIKATSRELTSVTNGATWRRNNWT
jgi:hypothetical protein